MFATIPSEVRPIEPEVDGEPVSHIVDALAEEDESATQQFRAGSLYNVLEQRGFDPEVEQVADNEWHVEFEHA